MPALLTPYTQHMILYAYGIVASDEANDVGSLEPVPGGEAPRAVGEAGWTMIVSSVPSDEYSQESIDRHADDLEWLGAIGLGHQRINDALATRGDVIPLRAFTLFSDESAVRRWLDEQQSSLETLHARIAGKLEWTIKLELTGTGWMNDSATDELEREIAAAPAGKAFLLKKKLERELERSRGEMENDLVREVAASIERRSGAEAFVETRLRRGGADPQIDLLYDRNRLDELEKLIDSTREELEQKEIRITVTGPWPPYSFTDRLARDA